MIQRELVKTFSTTNMEKLEKEAGRLVKPAYVRQGLQNLQTRQHLLSILLTHKKLPVRGWDDRTIEFFLGELATMDSNNFTSNVGVGEREGRVYSRLVSERHYGMSHGIGRSGDIAEVQPKAAGSSLLYKLAVSLVQHALQLAGLKLKGCVILPLATGMALTMSMLTLRQRSPGAKYVIWSRIDQKSCFKSISTAGLVPLVVQLKTCPKSSGEGEGEALETDCDEIERLLTLHGDEVLCVLTTTSCFAPRQPDSVDVVARLCAAAKVAHVINNAYGIQCPVITKLVTRACTVGRVDYVVQSTDKNFMVPVGGSIVLSPDKESIQRLSATYPGRASVAPIMDVLVTLLSMGEEGFTSLLKQRLEVNEHLVRRLRAVAAEFGEGLLSCPRNCISTAVTLAHLDVASAAAAAAAAAEAVEVAAFASGSTHTAQKQQLRDASKGATFLGAMLFQRGVSGCRVVERKNEVSEVEGVAFTDWGSHSDSSPCSYFTAACAVGTSLADVDTFITRLQKVMGKLYPKTDVEKEESKIDNSM